MSYCIISNITIFLILLNNFTHINNNSCKLFSILNKSLNLYGNIKKEEDYIIYYHNRIIIIKKHINEETNDMEKNALKLFVVSYERCLKQELTAQETQQLTNIQTEVLALSKGNDKIKFKISDLASAKGAVSTVKKTRKCQKQTYKHMTKTDRRLLKKAISKLSLQTIVSMYHGIR